MPLQKQLAHINLVGGIQKKDDERLTIPSKLAVADNVEFDDSSTIVRRGGQVKHALTATQSPSVDNALRMFTHQNNLVIESEAGLHRVNPVFGTTPVKLPTYLGLTTPTVFTRGSMLTSRIGSVERKGTAYGSGIPIKDGAIDCANMGGLTCYVWETRDTSGYGRQAIKVVIVDDDTGAHVYSNLITGGAAEITCNPRVVANETRFFIYFAQYASGATTWNLNVTTITAALSASTPFLVATNTTGGTTGSAGNMPIFDIAISHDFTIIGGVVLDDNSTDTIRFQNYNLTNGHALIGGGTTVATATPTSLTCLINNKNVYAFYGIGTNVAKGAYFNTLTTVVTPEATVGTGAVGTEVGRLAAWDSITVIYLAFDSVTTVGTGVSSCLRISRFNGAFSLLTECAGPAPWVIAGRIRNSRTRLYLPMALVSDLYQSTVFVVDFTHLFSNLGAVSPVGPAPHVLARIDYGECALNYDRYSFDLRVPGTITKDTSDTDPVGDILILPYLKYETDARVVGDDDETAFAAASATLTMTSQLGDEEVNGITFLAGACPLIYDGELCVEEGFHHGPEILDTTPTPAASGLYQFANATATYTICFTQAWQDAQGNWWESMPSNEVQVTITGGSGNYYITPDMITAPTLKPGARLLMYRTQGSSTDTSLYIATRADDSTVTDDAELISGEQLYTAGEVLPNTPAPACRHVSLFQKRLVLSGCGDGSVIHWSKQTSPGFCPEFSDGDPTHQTTIPKDAGKVVGTRELDDRLIVFGERSVGLIYGTGPSATGLQGQYSDFATALPTIGCDWESPKSITRGPGGVWFRSPFGVRFFGQSGSLAVDSSGHQVGSEIDPLVSGRMVGVSGGTKQQSRFYQDDAVLVFDHQWGQWSRFPNISSVDAAFANSRYYHLYTVEQSGGVLRYFDDAVTTDVDESETADVVFDSYIETSWLSFAGIQGFQRIYRMMLIGKNTDEAIDPANISISLGYDFAPDSPPTGSVTNLTITPVLGGGVQLQHHLERQKCESLKIGIAFRPEAGGSGRLRLSDLTLQVGAKPGYFKLPSSQRY